MNDNVVRTFTPEKPVYKGPALWNDPLPSHTGKPELPAVLLSDRIAYYGENFGLVVPFNREHLRPASYELGVGDSYYCNGKTSELHEGESLTIEPNNLVYIRAKEFFNIPYYMAGRYSVLVRGVYRGLVLDNGLQIDPGFHGHINVPIYNFTSEPKCLKYGERFLAIEFVKTTPFEPCPPLEADEERDWVRPGIVSDIGYPIKLFRDDPDALYHDRGILEYFVPGETNASAVHYLTVDINDFRDRIADHKKQVERTQRITWVGLAALLVAFLAILIPCAFGNRGLIADVKADTRSTLERLQERVTVVEETLESQGQAYRGTTSQSQKTVGKDTELNDTPSGLRSLERQGG